MSFRRVINYIKRVKHRTFVCVVNGRAKCMAAGDEKAERILREQKPNILVVGVYTPDVDERWLALDLREAGVDY